MEKNTPIPPYPDSAVPDLGMRAALDPLFKGLKSPVSEFSFPGIYLFRRAHAYRLSVLEGGLTVITGRDRDEPFFMLPFGLPDRDALETLFSDHQSMKNATEEQARELTRLGYEPTEDRDNFDYVYLREELSKLEGRKFHSQKNLVNAFSGEYECEPRPLLTGCAPDADKVLSTWCDTYGPGDCEAAAEAVGLMDPLGLCGAIYYIEGRPVGFVLGSESTPDTFVIHFEKGMREYKGLMQFMSMSFASMLPEKYVYINREQDLGDEGLRRAKTALRPSGFVKKFRVSPRRG